MALDGQTTLLALMALYCRREMKSSPELASWHAVSLQATVVKGGNCICRVTLVRGAGKVLMMLPLPSLFLPPPSIPSTRESKGSPIMQTMATTRLVLRVCEPLIRLCPLVLDQGPQL